MLWCIPSGSEAANTTLPVMFSSDNKAPIKINSDTLELFDRERSAIYTGHVTIEQGAHSLKADKVHMLFDVPSNTNTAQKIDSKEGIPKDKSAQPVFSAYQLIRLEASGNVILASGEQKGKGNTATYDKKTNKITLSGDAVLTQGLNVIQGDHIIYDLVTERAVVKGNVRSSFIPQPAAESKK